MPGSFWLKWQGDNFEETEKIYQASQKCDLISVAWKWRKIGRVNFKLCPNKH